ncbi:MAG: hypothetical protein RMK29_18180 [Myxococcales bacterium]|nr:hypothetical protein [Myxococcota bacterium]MDW8283640.1 hypothetical protein [Myxococcales bacterium]
MSDGPVHKEKKQGERPAGAGINAALRFGQQDEDRAQAAAHAFAGPREGTYISAGLPRPETEAERPSERPATSAAALYQAYEAACDPDRAEAPGFVGPCSFGMSVFGAPPLQLQVEGASGAPQAIPGGGPVSWTRRRGMRPVEIGPPPAHPLSVASPLGLGVAGGAWNASDPLQQVQHKLTQQQVTPAMVQSEGIERDGSEPRGDGSAGSAETAVGDAWSGIWN